MSSFVTTPLAKVKKGQSVRLEGETSIHKVTRNVKAPDWTSERRVYLDGNGWIQGAPTNTIPVQHFAQTD
jgi:hypothetical protein